MPDGLDAKNVVRFGEIVGSRFSQDPYDILESRTAPRFRTCESVCLLNLFQDAGFSRVHSIFEGKLHKAVVFENNFGKLGILSTRCTISQTLSIGTAGFLTCQMLMRWLHVVFLATLRRPIQTTRDDSS